MRRTMIGMVICLSAAACTSGDAGETTTSTPPSGAVAPITSTTASSSTVPEPAASLPAGWELLAAGEQLFVDATVTDAAVIDGTVVAVGSTLGAAAWHSFDGITWARGDVQAEMFGISDIEAVDAGPAGFVAVGWSRASVSAADPPRPTAWHSTDGVDWTPFVLGTRGGRLVDVAAIPAGYIAIGARSEGVPLAFRSSDGTTWAQVTDAAWAGSGVIAVASNPETVLAIDGSGLAWRSSDLSSWDQGGTLDGGRIASVIHHRDRFIAVGENPDREPAIWSSPDGNRWDASLGFSGLGIDPADYEGLPPVPVPTTVPPEEDDGTNFTVISDSLTAPGLALDWIYAVGDRFVAGSADDPKPLLASDDGFTWHPDVPWRGSDDVVRVLSIVELPTGALLLANPDDYSGFDVWRSDQGIDWDRVGARANPLDDTRIVAIVEAGPGLVAASSAPTGAALLASSDGRSWTHSDLGEATITALAASSDGVVALGFDANGRFTAWRSLDGLDWETHPQDATETWIAAFTVGGPGFIAVGSDNPFDPRTAQAWTSCAGVTWHEVPRSAGQFLRAIALSVAAGEERSVAVGFDDIWTSPDGIRWERSGLPFESSSVVALGSEFVAVGDGLWSSTDGFEWTELPGPDGFSRNDPTATQLIAAGEAGVVVVDASSGTTLAWTSNDARTWRSIPTADLPEDQLLETVTTAGGGLYTAGPTQDGGSAIWSWQPDDGFQLEPASVSPRSDEEFAACRAALVADIEAAAEETSVVSRVEPESPEWFALQAFIDDVTAEFDAAGERLNTIVDSDPDLTYREYTEALVAEMGTITAVVRALAVPAVLEEAFGDYLEAFEAQADALTSVLAANPDAPDEDLDALFGAAIAESNAAFSAACSEVQRIYDINEIDVFLGC